MAEKPRPTPERAREILARALHVSEEPSAPVLLTGKRQALLEAVLAGCNIGEAAEKAGYNSIHAGRVMKEPKFRQALALAQRERRQAALTGMDALVPMAIRRLGDILRDPSAKDSDVIAAASQILDRAGVPKTERIEFEDPEDATPARDAEEIMGRLRVLEGGGDAEAG